MIPFLLVLPLLVTLAQGNMPISGCSVPNSCFGLPANCQPDTNCHVYFQFDQEGNLDVNVKDVTDEDAYIALAVDIQPGLSVDYLICLPKRQRRLRAFSVKGQPIQDTGEKMARLVQEVSANNFICTFHESELPPNFRQKSLFFVTEGIFASDDDQMIIPPGRQLSPINSDFVYMHNIAATSMDNEDEMVLTPEENKMTSDLVKKVQRISKSADKDIDLEDILNGSEEEEEQEDDLEDMLDSRKKYSTRKKDLQKKKKVASRRDEDDEDEEEEEEEKKPRRRNGRPSRYQEDDDDEDEDEDYVPKKKSRRPSSRRFDSDEEDDEEEEEEEDNHKGKSRKNKNHNKKKGKKSDDDDYEEEDEERQDDDEYDDERNSENAYPYTIPVIIVTLVYCFLIRN